MAKNIDDNAKLNDTINTLKRENRFSSYNTRVANESIGGTTDFERDDDTFLINTSLVAGSISASGEIQASVKRRRRDEQLYTLEDLREADDLEEEDDESEKIKDNADSLNYSEGTGTMGATTLNFGFTATKRDFMNDESEQTSA